MTKEDYEIADYLSKDALSDFELDNDPLRWLEKYASLFNSICKLQQPGETKPIMLFGIKFYLQLGSFHGKYEKLMREHEFKITDL
jgi:hypothetical protein